MNNIELIKDNSNWYSFYYELSIETSKSNDKKLAYEVLKYLWKIPTIFGPFDKDGNYITIWPDNEMFCLYGIILIDGIHFPIATWFINEPNRSNWIDFCFSDGFVSKMKNKDKIVKLIYSFLEKLLYNISSVFKFNIALIGEECSGLLTLDDLNGSISNYNLESTKLFIQEWNKSNINISENEKVYWI